jgi:hypothetical protein
MLKTFMPRSGSKVSTREIVNSLTPRPMADLEVHQVQQAHVDPDAARLRKPGLDALVAIRGRRAAQPAAQRVARIRRLQFDQLGALADHRDAAQADGACAFETAPRGLVAPFAGRLAARFDQQVGRQHLGGLPGQRAFDAIGEQAHGADRTGGDCQGQREHVQLTGTQVAQQRTPGEAQRGVHSTTRPSSSASVRAQRAASA